jgi:hypothetical protein
MLPLLAAIPASASILSATGQAVGTRPSNADYLRVNVVQDELNTTMRNMNDESLANGSISAQAPSVSEGAYVLQKEGTGGDARINPKLGGLVISAGDDHEAGRVPISITGSGSDHGIRTHPYDSNRDHRNDPHAAPEPSTWMLLGTGLAMLGGYATLRRRLAVEN